MGIKIYFERPKSALSEIKNVFFIKTSMVSNRYVQSV
jgi:hypothetical protein